MDTTPLSYMARGPASPDTVRIGVSRCLLGDRVRYDGGHQLDRFVRDTLGAFVEYVPICPEVECGLPVPREAMRLVGDPASPRLVTRNSGEDHTERMQSWAAQRLHILADEGICAFIFKSRSPSSGMARVKVYQESGHPLMSGTGIFARMLMDAFPLLPFEDDGRLNDHGLREHFIECVFVFHRLRLFCAGSRTVGELMTFHTRHKLLLMAHSPEHYRQLGRLVAGAKGMDQDQVLSEYITLLAQGLQRKATPAKHCNVLQHCLGYFKKQLTTDEKAEALELIEQYRAGDLPLIVPVTLINHFVRKYGTAYLAEQWYLRPHPPELRLRNHA